MELKLSQYHNLAYRNILYLDSKAALSKFVAVIGPTSLSLVREPSGSVKLSGDPTTVKPLGLITDGNDVMIGWR